jgi:hypothetical protein
MNGWMDESMGRWKGGWMDGWMDRWMDGRVGGMQTDVRVFGEVAAHYSQKHSLYLFCILCSTLSSSVRLFKCEIPDFKNRSP